MDLKRNFNSAASMAITATLIAFVFIYFRTLHAFTESILGEIGSYIVLAIVLFITWQADKYFSSLLDRKTFPEEWLNLDESESFFEGCTYIKSIPLSILAIANPSDTRVINSGDLADSLIFVFKVIHWRFIGAGQYVLSVAMKDAADQENFLNDSEDQTLHFTVSAIDSGQSSDLFIGVDRETSEDTSKMEETISEEVVSKYEAELRAEIEADFKAAGAWLGDEHVEITGVSVQSVGIVKVLAYRFRYQEAEMVKIYLTIDGVSYFIIFGVPRYADQDFICFLESFYRSISVTDMGYLDQLSIMKPGFMLSKQESASFL